LARGAAPACRGADAHAPASRPKQEALRAEIERKRKATAEVFGGRKFMKVADIEAAREAQKRAAGDAEPGAAAGPQARGTALALGLGALLPARLRADAWPRRCADAQETSTAVVPSTVRDVAALCVAPASSETLRSCFSQARDAAPPAAASAQTTLPPDVEALSEAEAVARLRALGHPATLFGEGTRDRLLRLHVVQRSIAPRVQDDLGEGQQANEKQRALRELEQAAKVRSRLGSCAALALTSPPSSRRAANEARGPQGARGCGRGRQGGRGGQGGGG
jgi:hypothetical protein